jgi:hypothetical protein
MPQGSEQSTAMFQGVLEAPSVRPVVTPKLVPTQTPQPTEPPSKASQLFAAANEMNHQPQQPYRRTVSKSRLAEIRQERKSRAFNGRIR